MWIAIIASILAPFCGALAVAGFSRLVLPPKVAGVIATLAAFGSFGSALVALGTVERGSTSELTLWVWAAGAGFQIRPSLMVDGITVWMLAVVSGVSALIHLYSIGYMEGDSGIWRYFATINFFLGSMLLLVGAGSLVVLMAGWAGVGLASYLLIAHWFEKPEAAAAGVKAFVVNAVGDAGLVLATLTAIAFLGTDQYRPILDGHVMQLPSWALVLLFLGILLAALAKSAQVPMQIWLPDAMAGPTPVSALIHAATMVTAGVYLLVRFQPMMASMPWASTLVMAIGTATLLLGATAATAQVNIKRVLAYSTISQLGYMFVAAGATAPGTALFHLTGHAFFKALLFLAAGIVIHALAGEEDMRRMGGLASRLPFAQWTFLVGTIGLAGLPPAVGFFSKDEVISSAAQQPPEALWAVFTILGAVVTSFYGFRAWVHIFFGQDRSGLRHVHKPGWTMTIPTLVLALATLLGGLLRYPSETLAHLLDVRDVPAAAWVPVLSTAAAIGGAGLAWLSFRRRPSEVYPTASHGRLWAMAASGWGFDMAYHSLLVKPILGMAGTLRILGERAISGVTVGLASWIALQVAWLVQQWQSGYLRPYLWTAFLGILALIVLITIGK
jgi:NADH-quinone oxidoreductase subunit L